MQREQYKRHYIHGSPSVRFSLTERLISIPNCNLTTKDQLVCPLYVARNSDKFNQVAFSNETECHGVEGIIIYHSGWKRIINRIIKMKVFKFSSETRYPDNGL